MLTWQHFGKCKCKEKNPVYIIDGVLMKHHRSSDIYTIKRFLSHLGSDRILDLGPSPMDERSMSKLVRWHSETMVPWPIMLEYPL